MFNTYNTNAIVKARRLVCYHSDGTIKQASAATDKICGASDDMDVKAGGIIDVKHLGEAKIEYGGTISAGDFITSDADGCAIAAAAGNNIAGFALFNGVKGDICSVMILPQQAQTSAQTDSDQ